MNYYGSDLYCTDLLIYIEKELPKQLIEENVNKLKALFPMYMNTQSLVLIDQSWIGIDCDSLHGQIQGGDLILKGCAKIWQCPVIMYDIFDEDIIILGYGDAKENIYEIGHSTDCFEEEELLEFPQGLLPYFKGQEDAVQRLWLEKYTFESDKLIDIQKLMSKPMPFYMLGRMAMDAIPDSITKMII